MVLGSRGRTSRPLLVDCILQMRSTGLGWGIGMDVRVSGLIFMILPGCSSKLDEPVVAAEALNSEACQLPAGPPLTIKIRDAIANSAAFDGRLVSLDGYYCAGFEMSALYETPDCEARPESGLWLGGASPFYASKGRRVIVTGILDSRLRGHLEKWPAGICTAKLVEPHQQARSSSTSNQ